MFKGLSMIGARKNGTLAVLLFLGASHSTGFSQEKQSQPANPVEEFVFQKLREQEASAKTLKIDLLAQSEILDPELKDPESGKVLLKSAFLRKLLMQRTTEQFPGLIYGFYLMNAVIEKPLNLAEAEFRHDLIFDSCIFRDVLNLSSCKIEGNLSLVKSRFDRFLAPRIQVKKNGSSGNRVANAFLSFLKPVISCLFLCSPSFGVFLSLRDGLPRPS